MPNLETHVPVYIKVTDINDNAPEFADVYNPRVCENAAPGKVKYQNQIANTTQPHRPAILARIESSHFAPLKPMCKSEHWSADIFSENISQN